QCCRWSIYARRYEARSATDRRRRIRERFANLRRRRELRGAAASSRRARRHRDLRARAGGAGYGGSPLWNPRPWVPGPSSLARTRCWTARAQSTASSTFGNSNRIPMSSQDRDTFDRARGFLAEAMAEEPDFALPVAWAARWHSVRIGRGWSPNPDD